MCSHSSYNYDRGGLDTYERDFIDDTQLMTPSRRHRQRRSKGAKDRDEDESSSNSSDGGVVRRMRHVPDNKKVVLNISSSDSDGDAPSTSLDNQSRPSKELVMKSENKGGSEDDEEPKIPVAFLKRRKKTVSLAEDEESEDDFKKKCSDNEETDNAQKGKRRRLKQLESDDEIRCDVHTCWGYGTHTLRLRYMCTYMLGVIKVHVGIHVSTYIVLVASVNPQLLVTVHIREITIFVQYGAALSTCVLWSCHKVTKRERKRTSKEAKEAQRISWCQGQW